MTETPVSSSYLLGSGFLIVTKASTSTLDSFTITSLPFTEGYEQTSLYTRENSKASPRVI
jgi:hypothetical protein